MAVSGLEYLASTTTPSRTAVPAMWSMKAVFEWREDYVALNEIRDKSDVVIENREKNEREHGR